MKNRSPLTAPVALAVVLGVLALVPAAVVLLFDGGAAASTSDAVGTWPLEPRPTVVHGFDPPSITWDSGHRGVDLAGRIGQPVRAALPGTVSFTGSIAGVRSVVVDHGPTRTTYQPVAASVPRGTEVAAGEVIGHLEWFGTHCSPAACLHWGWIRGSEYLDPLLLVGPQPVRLLPLQAPAGPWLPAPTWTPVLPWSVPPLLVGPSSRPGF